MDILERNSPEIRLYTPPPPPISLLVFRLCFKAAVTDRYVLLVIQSSRKSFFKVGEDTELAGQMFLSFFLSHILSFKAR